MSQSDKENEVRVEKAMAEASDAEALLRKLLVGCPDMSVTAVQHVTDTLPFVSAIIAILGGAVVINKVMTLDDVKGLSGSLAQGVAAMCRIAYSDGLNDGMILGVPKSGKGVM